MEGLPKQQVVAQLRGTFEPRPRPQRHLKEQVYFPTARGGPRSRKQHKKPALLVTIIRNQGRGVKCRPEGGHTPLKSSKEILPAIKLEIEPVFVPQRRIENPRSLIIVQDTFTTLRDSYKLFRNKRFRLRLKCFHMRISTEKGPNQTLALCQRNRA